MSKKHEVTAIIFDKRGRVLSVGQNSYTKTSPYQARLAKKVGQPAKQYLHAEIAAICRLRDRKDGPTSSYRICIMRFGAGGEPRYAKPCAICDLAIREAGIKRIEHT